MKKREAKGQASIEEAEASEEEAKELRKRGSLWLEGSGRYINIEKGEWNCC